MGFELRHLRNFVVVAEEMHFGRAAKRLAISQPPLSVSIQQLEEAVGARLLNRDSKGVRLTPAGEAFRKDAQILLSKADEASALAREISVGAVGRMRVGFVGSMLFRRAAAMGAGLSGPPSADSTRLTELNSNEQIDALLRDELDVGFVHARRVPEALSI